MQTKKMFVFRDYGKLAFLNAYSLLEDVVESVRAEWRGNIKLREWGTTNWEGGMFICQY